MTDTREPTKGAYRTSRTLALYLGREIVIYASLSFLALTTVLVSQNLLRKLDDLVSVGVDIGDFFSVVGLMFATLVAYSLPIAFLLGVFFAFSRLSSEGEIAAMRASGLGQSSVFGPALALGLACSLATWLVMNVVEHRAHRGLLTRVGTFAARGGMLEAGRFRELGGRVLYVHERDRDNRLRGVMISDSTNPERPFVIFAESGHFRYDETEVTFRLGLENGALHLDAGPGLGRPPERMSFDRLDYAFDVAPLIEGIGSATRPRQMSNDELSEVIARAKQGDALRELDQKDPIEYELEAHRRRAMPLASLIFAAMAVPLGLGRLGRSQSRGAITALVLVFGYYSLGIFCRFLAAEGWFSAGFALWLPNLVFGAAGCVLILRSRRINE